MPLSLWIALRSLFSRRSRYAHSAIGWITILGLVLGVTAQGVALSILGGFEKTFTRSILGFNAHLVLMREGEISDPNQVLKKLEPFRGGEGITAVTPFLYREGLVAHHSKVKGIVMKGIDPLTFQRVYDVKIRLFSSPSEGTPLSELLKSRGGNPPILLGSDVAEALGVGPDDRVVSLLSPQGELKKAADVNHFIRLEVIGTFTSGLYEYDSQFALMNLSEAQGFFKVPGKVTGFEMQVGRLEGAKDLARRIEGAFGVPFQAIPWDELNAEIFYALRLEKKLFFILMGLIVAVAAANLVGLVVILVTDQSKEVSIFRAMGIKPKTLSRVFTLQGMILAAVGGFLGSGLGFVFVYLLSRYSVVSLAKEVYLVSSLPIELSWKNFGGVLAFSTGISYLATRMAARRVLRMKLDL
jgi:lipoprotein-releasing system permease protein